MSSIRSSLLTALVVVGGIVYGQKVQWMTWEQAVEKSKVEPKKFFVDVYTDWCGWCKKMDASTFQHPVVATYLNENYYSIKFNAEQREDIRLKEKVYRFIRSGRQGYHELAHKITLGRLSYPTVVFMDENLEIIQPIPGYKDAKMFEMIMTYFAENHHKTTPWKTYTTNYKGN